MNAALRIVDIVTANNDKKFEPAGRMAAAIVELTRKNGGCLPQDLNALSFTPAEVTDHWHMALSLAEVELNLLAKKI